MEGLAGVAGKVGPGQRKSDGRQIIGSERLMESYLLVGRAVL